MKTHTRYELFEEIGRGETAVVYRGHDMNLGIPVAVKEFRDELRGDARAFDQFCATAQFLAGLGRHDHVVLVREVDRENGWIVMDLMAESLEQVLARGKVAPAMVRSILRQALDGLSVLHERGRLHGSVKPSNLLVDDRGSVRLGDCAGSSAEDEMPAPRGSYKGMAPELCDPSFGPVGPGIDLYGAGFTALELLMGREAFAAWFRKAGVDSDPGAADKGVSWLRWHGSREEQLPPAAELVPGLPDDLARTIDGLLRKQVSERIASAADAVASLDAKPVLLFPAAASAAAAAAPPAPEPPRPRPAPSPGDERPSPPPRRPDGRGRPRNLVGLVAGSLLAAVAGTAPLWGPAAYRRMQGGAGGTAAAPARSEAPETVAAAEPKPPVRPVAPVVEKAKTPAADPPAEVRGSIEVAASPTGAVVRLAGAEGETEESTDSPARFERRPGKYRLRVDLPGYISIDREVEIVAGPPQRLDLKLDESPRPAPPVEPPPGQTPAPPAGPSLVDGRNTVGMRMIEVPPGRFLMGSPEGEGSDNERPRREVAITRPFLMAATEVTRGQYRAVMGADPSRSSAEGDDLPVENVSHDMAVDFCDALSRREGRPPGAYRLPTEAEWEYAARGGPRAGEAEDAAPLAEVAWFVENAQGRPHAVAGKRPNALGLYDTSGNVWEWCADWYDPGYYAASDNAVDPRGPAAPVGEGLKVLRGGAWLARARLCRPADRYAAPPADSTNAYGFRVVLDAPAGPDASPIAADGGGTPPPPATGVDPSPAGARGGPPPR